jgi:hypothetical protein
MTENEYKAALDKIKVLMEIVNGESHPLFDELVNLQIKVMGYENNIDQEIITH